jgi:two-component system, OmpR family, sensor histidine kinase KdpD
VSEAGRDPDAILSLIKDEEERGKRGHLKIFLGAIAGVGKTYSMLSAARQLRDQSVDVVVGYVETHGRLETEALLPGLEILPVTMIEYQGRQLKEFDVDAALARNPELILVDELAHTNVPGSRHTKRWHDVQELLEAGIDVLTTMNVQHIESLHDVVAQITRVSVSERVPDSFLEKASEIELVDLPPEELLERLREGKVYVPEQAKTALEHFFQKGNIIALRELALRYTAERVVADMEHYRHQHQIKATWPASERILVCVSPSPFSIRLVRSGKRMADALHAKWIVVYVEGPRQISLSETDRNRVTQTLRLAEQLGAETLELSGTNVPEEIIKCARQYNISKIIIGKPARPRWQDIMFGSVIDEVVRLSGATDVYVISGEGGTVTARRSRRLVRTSKVPAYVWAALVVAGCTGFAELMLRPFEPCNIVMTYILGILFVATRFGRGPSLLACILSVTTFDFFFVPPYFSFSVADTRYLITFAVMLVVALVISNLTATIRQQAQAARLRETRTAALYSMSRELSSTLDIKGLLEIGLRHIADVFEGKVALFLPDSEAELKLAAAGEGNQQLADLNYGVALWSYRNRKMAGPGTDTLPGVGELYVPLLSTGGAIGVLVIRPEQPDRLASPEQHRLLETFANQLALAYERAQLSIKSEQAQVQIKTEQLRSSLLSSVSHDLRTPLATISGAASSIIEASSSLSLESYKQMAGEIYHESMRMNRLVANLLDMTRLQSGTLQVIRELHPVDELIGAALNCCEGQLHEHPVVTSIPADVAAVSVDATLIQQVLLNLIENAVKYTPQGCEICISARQEEGFVEFSVADRGPGIAEEHRQKIFEKFFREANSRAAGVGLGLSICAGIIEAHQGKIWVENRPGGGAIFKFTLTACPLPLPPDLAAAENEVDDVHA